MELHMRRSGHDERTAVTAAALTIRQVRERLEHGGRPLLELVGVLGGLDVRDADGLPATRLLQGAGGHLDLAMDALLRLEEGLSVLSRGSA
jgi:hypothetical protein